MRRLVRRMTLVAAVALLVGAPATGFAAGFQNYAQSATATAMGGVGVANPNEPNASFMNPALMSQHDDFNIYLGDTLIIPNTTYKPLGGADEEVSTESTIFPPPNGHVGYGVTDDLSVGIGANRLLARSAGSGVRRTSGTVWKKVPPSPAGCSPSRASSAAR